MQARYSKYVLNFKKPSGTSRGVMLEKETWFLILEDSGRIGIGECGILRGLSYDDRSDYEEKLKWTCDNIVLGEQQLYDQLMGFPSIQFGVEMAFLSLASENPFELFPSDFTKHNAGIPINGLVWMGQPDFMMRQINDKLADGFSCIKLKIGAIDFGSELELIRNIRQNFTPEQVEIRVDANGAFASVEALDKLNQLAEFELHSIEQPIEKNQHDTMSELCKATPIPIALDEELIGVLKPADKQNLLENIKPQYIILKPSFIGGIRGTKEWIALAESLGIGWWITSALESNIGLNAIAQFTAAIGIVIPQGLGTGGLYTNNFESPLEVRNGNLYYNLGVEWKVDFNQL
ncbi:MAG TPA: o-succinylbenzoate synthase [Flavobacterium sp.]